MSAARELPRQAAVIGDGQLGVLAAIALRRALPASEVIVVGLPRHPEALADRAATALSFTNRLHDRLGVDEDDLIRRAGASHRLVVRYVGWAGSGVETIAPSSGAIDPALRSVFAREWGPSRDLQTGGAPVGSVAEALASAGRFARPSGEPNAPLGELDYALRWNVGAYRDLLIATAHSMGVRYLRGSHVSVKPDGRGGAAAIAVTGNEIAADLFVDCSGPRAQALSQLPGFSRVAWGAHLPVRALLHAERRPVSLSLEDRVSLTAAGWVEECAGRDGATRMLAAPGGLTEESLVSALGETPVAAFALDPGRAERSWVGNVVALGDAAATFEPLGWLNLDLAHRQLALLLELLPGREPNVRERDEYNRRAALMADRARDIVAAHYFAPGAAGLFAGIELSAELSLTLDQFHRRGRIPVFEETPLLPEEWSSILMALGLPMSVSQLAKAQSQDSEARARAALAARCKAATDTAPQYPVWLRRVLEAAQPCEER